MSFLVKTFFTKLLQYNTRLFEPLRRVQLSQVKHLYTPASLGIDSYLVLRERVKKHFANLTDEFRSKMSELVNDPKNMVLTEDLYNILHIAEPTDLKLILDMIKKFNAPNNDKFRFGTFVIGPVVMRMFHFLDASKEALQCFEEQCNSGFFDQQASYHVLLDLLYTHEMYDDMYRVFDKMQERQIKMIKFHKYPVVLVLAACYKQNTPQSFEYAAKLWTEMTNAGSVPVRRACTFFAGLALKQGAPNIALESVSTLKQHYVIIRNIRAMAFADMGRVDDALPILRAVLEIDVPEQKDKHTFSEETILKVKEAVQKSNNKDIQKQFEIIEKALKDLSLIDDQTLDKVLNAEITLRKRNTSEGFPGFTNKGVPFALRLRRDMQDWRNN